MSLRVRDAGALRTGSEAYLRGEAGQQPIDRMLIRGDAGVSEFYRRGIRPTVNPSNVSGFSRSRNGPVVTGTVVVSLTGGTAPYTHSWTPQNGIVATVPNGSTTAFRGTPAENSGDLFSILIDTITDANGLTATVSVGVSLTRESGV